MNKTICYLAGTQIKMKTYYILGHIEDNNKETVIYWETDNYKEAKLVKKVLERAIQKGRLENHFDGKHENIVSIEILNNANPFRN